MASEMDRPMASKASVARVLVRVSMRARTKVSAVLMGYLPEGGFTPPIRSVGTLWPQFKVRTPIRECKPEPPEFFWPTHQNDSVISPA